MKKYITLSIASLLLLGSCGEDFFDQVVDVEVPEHTPALAITSSLSNTDSILWTYVSNSVGILEPENPEAITDAKVELFKNGELFQALPHVEEGFYGWLVDGPLDNDGAAYELKVEKDGFESVSAVQTMPKRIDIIDASFEKDGIVDLDGERSDEYIVKLQDEKDVANYYKVEAFREYEYEGTVYQEDVYLGSNDPSMYTINRDVYLNDLIFDGEEAEIRLYGYAYIDESFMENVKIRIRLVHITKEKYFREVSIYNYDPENPFAEPTIVFSNIDKGHGIFSLEAVGPEFVVEL